MINDEICKLREELNKSIVEGKDYKIVYKISIELDKLIAEYYQETSNKHKKKQKRIYTLISVM